MDATRGVTNAVLLAVTLAIFNALSKKASDLAGLNGAVIFCPLLAGKVLDTYGNAGYHILFIFLAVMMVIGIILLTFYKRLVKKM